MSKRPISVRPPPSDTRPKNRLLACLPPDDFRRLRPHLTTRPITVKQVFQPFDQPVREVFFPNGGVVSVTAVMKNGAMVEIATVGDEGLLGINALFGDDMVRSETMMQVPDTDMPKSSRWQSSNGSSNGAAPSTRAFSVMRKVFSA